ncbi:dienelactone hydrolase family protein [Paraflavitalea pollutisoli]|uniref:dienelactone hydrolase family protein n=1 Tax=Paraflavitalea pollutisoli TaxID=3034143 RepID=UPI0023EC5323|nr:CocE/NonD family hydrolase [Paraflavitalea sp. H1-2-19X]
MRLFILLLVLFSSLSYTVMAQVSLKKLSPAYGKYAVGFKHYTSTDSSRTYRRIFEWNNQHIARPIPISIWYPSRDKVDGKTSLTVLDYLRILKAEEEWEHLPDDQLLNWFSYTNTPEHQQRLKEKTRAIAQLKPADGKFPAVVYAPGLQGASIENFVLCEFLASHGYIVIASPSRGFETRYMEGATVSDLETQARDIEFLVKAALGNRQVDADKIATMGYSFGGLSNVLAQTRNSRIKAIVSLDGSVKYQYKTLQQSPFYDIRKVNVPFIHMAQKAIPEAVLREDKLDSSLNTRFDFYDSLVNSQAYRLQFHQLTHAYFSAASILLQDRDARQDKPDDEIMQSYQWVTSYTLNFLNACLKNDQQAVQFLQREPIDNGIPLEALTIARKQAVQKAFSFEDFNERAAAQDYNHLTALHQSIVQQHPSFQLNEGKLNNLGLQLTFTPGSSRKGIAVLQLAIQLYPSSANLYDSLGEAFLFVKDKAAATQHFKRSLELDPQNGNAQKRLQELGK